MEGPDGRLWAFVVSHPSTTRARGTLSLGAPVEVRSTWLACLLGFERFWRPGGKLVLPAWQSLVAGNETGTAGEGEIGPYPGRKYRKEVDYSQMNARRSVSS